MICGDSFCMHKTQPESWVNQLSKLTNSTATSFGQPGCSNYNILQQYINNHPEKYDIAIVLKTSLSRIPFINKAEHLSFLLDPNGNVSSFIPKDYREALKFYLKYYFDYNFNKWTSKQSCLSILSNKPEKQKLIWVCIAENETEYELEGNNSIVISGNLMSIFKQEVLSDGYENIEKYHKENPKEYGKLNHLSLQNNYNLANFLKNVILDENANRDLSEHNWTFN